MSAVILSGRVCRDAIVPALSQKVTAVSVRLGRPPTLAIIQVGKRPDSTSYIRSKASFAKKIGANVRHIHLQETVAHEDVMFRVQECNVDPAIDGIIVQLPLPGHVDRDAVMAVIDPKKDADGLAVGSSVMPATARGVQELLSFYQIPLAGKRVTVVGRSKLVGGPIAEMCRKAGALVSVCHRSTNPADLMKETSSADVLVSAAGSAGLIGPRHVKPDAVVIDVGINPVSGEVLEGDGNAIVGDADYVAVKEIVRAITPVPGGVGPMTVCALFENLLDLCVKL